MSKKTPDKDPVEETTAPIVPPTPDSSPSPGPSSVPASTPISADDNQSLDDILSTIDSRGKTARSNGIATPEELNKVIQHILKANSLEDTVSNRNKIRGSIALLAQEGATSPRFNTNHATNSLGINLHVKLLQAACKEAGVTIRKVARALRSDAITVAKHFSCEGNLSKQYKLDNPDAQLDELIWASDFQTFSDDSAMPPEVKTWLLKNYNSRFNKPKNDDKK